MGAIPHDEYLRKAVRQQKPVVVAYPGSPSAHAFRQLASYTERLRREPGLSGGVEFFIERIIAEAEGAG